MAEPDAFPGHAGPLRELHRLGARPMVAFELRELRRLTPAVDFERS